MKLSSLRRIAFAVGCLCPIAACGQRYAKVEENGVSWLENQQHDKFFSLGVCVVDPGVPWTQYDTGNLAYAGFRFYPNEASWAADAASNLTKWGFNTIGAWSDYGPLLEAPNNHLYMTPILHMGSAAGAIWSDMWDSGIVNIMEEVAKTQIQARKQDPRVIGYFADNEQGWWKGSVFALIWEHKTHGTRRRAIDLLRLRYPQWTDLTRDFQAFGAKSYDELESRGKLTLKPGTNGIKAVTDILAMVAQRYYSLCRSIIKKYDPDALFLGDRYISNYYPEVAEQAGKYCDVVSTNLNADWSDGGFVRFHLSALEALTHRPLMVTEYYMTARENGTGDPNNSSDFPLVQTQAERAQGFVNTTKAIAGYPYLVGAHWFQYYDEPQKGRGDGENYDFGLVDANNHPYEDLIHSAQNLNLHQVHQSAKPFQASDSLPQSPDAWQDMTKWNRDQAFVDPKEAIARGDLYASWTQTSLNLGLFWQEDLQNEGLYADKKVPDADRSVIEIEIPATHTVWRLRAVGKDGQLLAGPGWTHNLSPETSTHQAMFLQIPSSVFGNATFQPGTHVSLNVRLVSETKAYTTQWQVSRTLAQ